MKKRILLTTSRRPNRRMRSFVKDLADVIPGAIRVTRGHKSMEELAFEAVNLGADRVVIVSDRRGNPGILRVYKIIMEEDYSYNLKNIVSFIIKGVALARERGLPSPSRASLRARKLCIIKNNEKYLYLEDEIALALKIAFHGSLSCNDARHSVIVNVKGINERTAEMSFHYKNLIIGPLIKIGKPSRLIKHG